MTNDTEKAAEEYAGKAASSNMAENPDYATFTFYHAALTDAFLAGAAHGAEMAKEQGAREMAELLCECGVGSKTFIEMYMKRWKESKK